MSNDPYNRSPPGQAPQQPAPYGDPFADRRPGLTFQEPTIPPREPRPFESTASLPHEFGGPGPGFNDEDNEEMLPLTGNQGFVGGLYPPGYVVPYAFF